MTDTRTPKHIPSKAEKSQDDEQHIDTLNTLLSASREYLSLFDTQGRYLYASERTATLLGLKQSDFLGKTWREVGLPARFMEPFDVQCQRVMTTGQTVMAEMLFPGDTQMRWFNSVASPVVDAHGQVESIVVSWIDTTEREQVEEATSRLASIVESSGDAIISKTLQEVITSWNSGAEILYGYTADEMIGKSVSLLIPPDRQNEMQEILALIAVGETVKNHETTRVRKDGKPKDVSVTISPIRDATGKIIGALTIAHDITKYKHMVEELATRSRQLEGSNEELATRSRELEGSVNELATRSLELEGSNEELATRSRELEGSNDELATRSSQLERSNKELATRSRELERSVDELATRSRQLERSNDELATRSRQLERSNDKLVTRSRQLEGSNKELATRSRELERSNKELATRSSELEGSVEELATRSRQLEGSNDKLVTRSRQLEGSNKELATRSRELERSNKELATRSSELEGSVEELATRSRQLEGSNKELATRSRELEGSVEELATRSRQLEGSNEELATRSRQLEGSNDKLVTRSRELEGSNEELATRSSQLERSNKELVTRSRELEGSVEELATRSRQLEGSNKELATRSRQLEGSNDELATRSSQLEGSNKDLGRQRDELASVNAALEEANRARSQFLSTMSHELRTPLASIIGFSQLLLDGATAAGWNQQQQNNLERILKNGQHLLGMINDVLDLAKIEAGRMVVNYSQVDVRELLTSVVEEIQSIALARELVLSVEVEEGVDSLETNPVKLRQILINLVSNALKFTEQGAVTVSARQVISPDGEADRLALAVRDSGVGIPADVQEHIFEPFYQVDGSYTRKVGGTGLGLSIVSQLTTVLGGTIELTSAPGQGSTFTVLLPIKVVEHYIEQGVPLLLSSLSQEVSSPLSSSPELNSTMLDEAYGVSALLEATGGKKQVVLAVDDNPEVLLLIKAALKDTLYMHVGVQDPSHVIDLVRELHPCAIILDVMMPHVNGWQLLHQLKENPATASIPIVMLSVLAEATTGYVLGADAYLIKPFQTEVILTTLQRVISLQKGFTQASKRETQTV